MHSPGKPVLEVCSSGLDAIIAAQYPGVSRLELCSSLETGGLTPALSLMESVCGTVSIPVHVMIRPRSGDFLYSDAEFSLMKTDIRHARKAGAAGVVFGILKSDGTIDRERCLELKALADPMKITFHRAFDMTVEPFFALEEIIAIGCETLLTSGQHQTAEDGLELIRELVKRAAGRIQIMAGSGVNGSNAELLYEAGVRAFHFSARKKSDSAMQFRNEALQSMGNNAFSDEYNRYVFDEEKVLGILKAIRVS